MILTHIHFFSFVLASDESGTNQSINNSTKKKKLSKKANIPYRVKEREKTGRKILLVEKGGNETMDNISLPAV